jgi:hypothetical protein
MVHAQPAHHTANVLAHIVECMAHANIALHMAHAKFVQDIQNNLLVQDIPLVPYAGPIINVNIAMDTLTDLAHLVAAPHLIPIIVTVQIIIK